MYEYVLNGLTIVIVILGLISSFNWIARFCRNRGIS